MRVEPAQPIRSSLPRHNVYLLLERKAALIKMRCPNKNDTCNCQNHSTDEEYAQIQKNLQEVQSWCDNLCPNKVPQCNCISHADYHASHLDYLASKNRFDVIKSYSDVASVAFHDSADLSDTDTDTDSDGDDSDDSCDSCDASTESEEYNKEPNSEDNDESSSESGEESSSESDEESYPEGDNESELDSEIDNETSLREAAQYCIDWYEEQNTSIYVNPKKMVYQNGHLDLVSRT